MKKIPTLFERDWNGDRSRVLDKVNPGCEWVLAGEGAATRKLDGTCCMIEAGKFYKRQEVVTAVVPRLRAGGFIVADVDPTTDKVIGWQPVGDGPEDRWHMRAFQEHRMWPDGTYELIGPKIQGNPECWVGHQLIEHGSIVEDDVPRTFDGLRSWLATQDIEGIVFHHPDGRRAKIKLRDFGLKRAHARDVG